MGDIAIYTDGFQMEGTDAGVFCANSGGDSRNQQ